MIEIPIKKLINFARLFHSDPLKGHTVTKGDNLDKTVHVSYFQETRKHERADNRSPFSN